jgi:uncharacterized protein with von Willebrand factor type A (vWA) domain
MSGGFRVAGLEQRYAFLDDCPPGLLPQVVSLPMGTLAERVAGVALWRCCLLDGRVPPASAWPAHPVAAPVLRALDELGMTRFCKGQPELVDALLGDILSSLVRQAEAHGLEVAKRLRELESLERLRLRDREQSTEPGKKRPPRSIRLEPDVVRKLREQAERQAADIDRGADDALVSAWAARARAWADIAEVFGDLAAVLGRGWDMALGVLRHTGWLKLVRLHALVKQLPQLREMIQALGRLHDSHEEASIAEQVFVPIQRLEEARREVRTPHLPAEMRGVERSGEIARMLPVEAAMLGHPALRMLWHARRAERALLTYYVEGVATERVWTETDKEEWTEAPRKRERGPIVVVIDTSGSMHGVPERVAKAVVLEAMRTAHAENRRCYLYAYSGPGQIVEHDLDLTDGGIAGLLDFLALSFGGGSDEAGVLGRVVTRLEQESWKNSDVLFVSDGEWPAPHAMVAMVRRARDRGSRFHGIQIGNRRDTGLRALCDPVHVFQDWAAVAGWDVASPAYET